MNCLSIVFPKHKFFFYSNQRFCLKFDYRSEKSNPEKDTIQTKVTSF